MLEELQHQIAANPEFGTKQVVTNIWILNKIHIAYEHHNEAEYRSSHCNKLAELGADLASGTKTHLGMIWFIKCSHWCSMDINTSQHTICYGDPEGDEAPNWLCDATKWWLSKHMEGTFKWEILPCPAQHDEFSCGILTQNGLAHSFLPAAHLLINTSSNQAVAIAHLKAGAEVIQHHIRMVCHIDTNLMIVFTSYIGISISHSCTYFTVHFTHTTTQFFLNSLR